MLKDEGANDGPNDQEEMAQSPSVSFFPLDHCSAEEAEAQRNSIVC